MFDKEIEAIAKCTELVKDLDEDSKYRVIKYLIERFGISTPNMVHPMADSVTINKTDNPILLQRGNTFHNHNTEDAVIDSEYPSLKDLEIKNYPKNETEWVLCYSFFASKYGNDTFTREEILEKYRENNRLNKSTSANLKNNIDSCIKKDWLKTSGDKFILKIEGLTYAKEVLAGNSTSKEVKSIKRKSKQTQLE